VGTETQVGNIEVETESEKETVEDFFGYTNIENNIVIEINIEENKQTFLLMKEKRTYRNFQTLYEEFLAFLKMAKAKKVKNKIIITSNEVFTPPFLRTILDNFFITYSWKYQ